MQSFEEESHLPLQQSRRPPSAALARTESLVVDKLQQNGPRRRQFLSLFY